MAMLTNKVALVTGAGAGIGRATALKFAEEGARVMVADLNVAGGEETVALIKKQGGEALFTRADVTDAAAVDALIRTAVDSFGRLDCACNNAGIEGAVVPFTDQSEDDYEAVMRVNAKGTFLCLRAEIRQMLQNGGGAIVNLASIAGLIGFTGLAPYVASKHAVNGLTKNAALEFGKQGIRVNSVCPGGIDTRMLDSLADQASGGAQSSRDMMEPLHPIGRIGTPEEVAELIVWLCSPRASFVTGANIPVDGGYVAQ
ncbi:SDR family oxidoreductase [Alloalcanivorax marinus]|uniref:SDR family oxidoreductase n=1 Tax=Alloalcanivorax marinus TaxID=1177169 RepID=UPI0019329A24|nr:SDR family oxidoreductase [Alloalcanivorax marinus]MBL7250530.1 SDR family oxidoreductase [Alloalcanivorax marinus]